MGNDEDVYDDYNEKQSKIQRDSKAFLMKAIVILGVLTVFALGLGILHQEPKLQSQSNTIIVGNNGNNGDENNEIRLISKGDTNTIQNANNKKSFKDIDTELAAKVDSIDKQVRGRKKTGIIMETDEEGLKLTGALQRATLKLLEHRYGANTRHTKFHVVVDVMYPESIIKDPVDLESHKGHFIIEMAPHNLIPCSVFYFMEIVRTYKSGEIHRNADHVLQVATSSEATAGQKPMPFQEYSRKFPHRKYTTGYAGRPSGPGWYVSIEDNTDNHGPGSQQTKNKYEADSNFGHIVDGVESGVIAKIHSVPEKEWLSDENCIKIYKMTLMVNSIDFPDSWTEWKPIM